VYSGESSGFLCALAYRVTILRFFSEGCGQKRQPFEPIHKISGINNKFINEYVLGKKQSKIHSCYFKIASVFVPVSNFAIVFLQLPGGVHIFVETPYNTGFR